MESNDLKLKNEVLRELIGMELYARLPIYRMVLPIVGVYLFDVLCAGIISCSIGWLFKYNIREVFFWTELVLSILYLFTIHKKQIKLGNDCLKGQLGELYKSGYNTILYYNGKYFVSQLLPDEENGIVIKEIELDNTTSLGLVENKQYLIGELIWYLIVATNGEEIKNGN